MSVLPNSKQTAASNAPAAQNYGVDLNNDSYNYAQVNSGPGAVLAVCMNQMIKNFAQLMEVNATLSAKESDVQGKMTIASQTAQKEAGAAQSDATKNQAFGEFASAASTLALGVGGSVYGAMGDASTGKASGELDMLKGNLAEVNKIGAPADLKLGPNNELQDATTFKSQTDEETLAAKPQIDKWKNGQELETMDVDSPAFKAMTKEDANGVRPSLQKAIETKERQLAHIDTISQRRNSMGQSLAAATGSTAKAGAGVYVAGNQVDMANENAEKTGLDYVQSTAGSMQQKTQQAITDEYNQILQTIAALKQGSNAYPQG